MLTQYQLEVNQLLQNPAATNALYATSDITGWINRARVQLAGDSECCRVYTTAPLTAANGQVAFSAIDLTANPAVNAVFNARFIWYQVGSGQAALRPRPWPWFAQYKLNNPVPPTGAPQTWAQYGQGESGSIFIDPIPDTNYTLVVDTVCVPIPLVDDTTVEAIPAPFTEAVCYYAAYLACLSAQAGVRQADADRHLSRYETLKNNARRYSNPSILPGIYEQAQSPFTPNQLGLQRSGGGG